MAAFIETVANGLPESRLYATHRMELEMNGLLIAAQ